MSIQMDDPLLSGFSGWPMGAQAIGINFAAADNGSAAPIPTRVEIAPAPDGTNAYRCTIDPNDTPTYSGIRAHVAYMRETAHNLGGAAERWYRWEMFFPVEFDAVDMLSVCQVHDTPDGGEGTVKFPNFEVMVQGEDIWIWTPLAAPTEGQTPRYPTGKRMKVIRGRWVTIAIHSNWSKLSDGFLEVYFDNELMVREWNRPCSYDDAIAPYWIIGMYDWEHKGTSLAHQYRVWYRNAKVYNTGHTAHEVLGVAPRNPQPLLVSTP